MCQNQHYISEYPYQETVYKVSFFLFPNIHSKTYVVPRNRLQDTSSRAPFSRSRSVTPSLRLCLHSDNPKIVSIPTNSILPNMVPSNNPVSNPSKPAIHQKTNRSIIPEKVLKVQHYVRIQRYRVIQYVTVTNHHVTAINHIYTAINESLIANRLSGYQI